MIVDPDYSVWVEELNKPTHNEAKRSTRTVCVEMLLVYSFLWSDFLDKYMD